MINKFKTFLAIYIPAFIILGVLSHKKIVGPWLGYTLASITILAIAWVVYQIKFKKK